MNDIDDTADRRERMESLRRRRQAARGGGEPSEELQRSIAGTLEPGGGGTGGQRESGQRAKQFAKLILKWMETTSDTGGETIAGTSVSRDGLTKLMALLSNVERRAGPGAKIAKMLRGFLARPAQQGESVVDGVNIEQLRKLIDLATRVRDQEVGRKKQVRQGTSRFWAGSAASEGNADAATADIDAALEPVDEPAEGAAKPPAGDRPGGPGKVSPPPGKRKQTKSSPSRPSRKK